MGNTTQNYHHMVNVSQVSLLFFSNGKQNYAQLYRLVEGRGKFLFVIHIPDLEGAVKL